VYIEYYLKVGWKTCIFIFIWLDRPNSTACSMTFILQQLAIGHYQKPNSFVAAVEDLVYLASLISIGILSNLFLLFGHQVKT